MKGRSLPLLLLIGCWLSLTTAVLAQEGASQPDSQVRDLAKQSQNPVGSLISLPLQNNTNFGYGPGDDVQNILNIQPVLPVSLSKKWILINRAILPVIYQPEFITGDGSTTGLGDPSYTAFFSPREPGKLI